MLLAGAVCVVLIGAPSLGRDFGGVLAALPGFMLLAMLLRYREYALPHAGHGPARGSAQAVAGAG